MSFQDQVAMQIELVHAIEPIKKSSIGGTSDPQVSTACVLCGAESLNNMTCQYCWKTFCEPHWVQHMAWEKGHEGFAEEYTRMWKKLKAAP